MLPRPRTEIIAPAGCRDADANIHALSYSTEGATLLAGDDWTDESHGGRPQYERADGRNRWLYVTPAGSYFVLDQGPRSHCTDRIEPVSKVGAMGYWTDLRNQRVTFAEAFHGVEVRPA